MSDLLEATNSSAGGLPMPLPAARPNESADLTAFRAQAADERAFMKLRRVLREREDWLEMAVALVLHGAASDKGAKIAELCIQAYEIFLERVKDREAAAHALARALVHQPDNARAYDRLLKLYQQLGWSREHVALLEWRIEHTAATDPARVPGMHVELGQLCERELLDMAGALRHYRRAIELDPRHGDAMRRLVDLLLAAGDADAATTLLEQQLQELDPTSHADRICEIHLQLAKFARERVGDLPLAARHLQAAVKAKPSSREAMVAFGLLYLGSGKATEDGKQKAASVFLKAGRLAADAGELLEATKLLRRSLALRPSDPEALEILVYVLERRELWLELDDVLRQIIHMIQGDDVVPWLVVRARLLETHLLRIDEARSLWEQASRIQGPEGEAWTALERIYGETGDALALAGLYEWRIDHLDDRAPTDLLLRTAKLYREQLDDEERAAFFFYRVLEREPFEPTAFEGYKEHWRRKHAWVHLRDLILYQIDQALAVRGPRGPLSRPEFAEEFVELADICERRLGDVDGAYDAWQRMAAAYAADPRPAEQVARIEKRVRMWDNMIRVQEAELARASAPSARLEVLRRLAQVYRDRQLDPTRAIELYVEILNLDPSDVQATRALTGLYERVGDHAQVVALLEQQYERSRSNNERAALLRRMSEIWHHELQATEQAMWACRQILVLDADDRESLHRLQRLLLDQQDHEGLLEALQREVELPNTTADARIGLLRRMARIAEHQLHDDERAGAYWAELLALRPDDLEIVDRLVALYELQDRTEELAALLRRAVDAPSTPPVRRFDVSMRLGDLARRRLGDAALARRSYETAAALRPDHRGALEVLAALLRDEGAWEKLAEVLARLADLADSELEVATFLGERADLQAKRLDDAKGAATTLLRLAEGVGRGDPDIERKLIEQLHAAGMDREVVARGELRLLASGDREERRRIYGWITEAWTHMGDAKAALAVHHRAVAELGEDEDALDRLATMQLAAGDYVAAKATLERRLTMLRDRDPNARIATLLRLSTIEAEQAGRPRQGFARVREALTIEPSHAEALAALDLLAARHGLQRELLEVWLERFERIGDDPAALGARAQLCIEAAAVAEQQLGDDSLAYAWLERGVLATARAGVDPRDAFARLEGFAEQHGMIARLLDTSDGLVDAWQRSGRFERLVDHVLAHLLEIAEIREHRLDDPQGAVATLQRALRIREDEEVERRLAALAERHQTWAAMISLKELERTRAETAIGRYDAWTAIAEIQEDKLKDPRAALQTLRAAQRDLSAEASTLAEEIGELITNVAERHEMWVELADHTLEQAREHLAAGDVLAGLESLDDAARTLMERARDGVAALRALLVGLEWDDDGVVLARIREIAELVDEADADARHLGASFRLRALQERLRHAQRDDRPALLEERALVREQQLGDVDGAIIEWMRVLTVVSEGDVAEKARAELARLASAHDAWKWVATAKAWEIQRARTAVERAELWIELSDLAHTQLRNDEWALRARLAALTEVPSLPGEPLDDDHDALWRLAKATTPYQGARAGLDAPLVAAPELADFEQWRKWGFDPVSLLPLADRSEDDSADAIPDLMPVVDRSGLVEAASTSQATRGREDGPKPAARSGSPVAGSRPPADDLDDVSSELDGELDDAELLEDAELEDAELLEADAELDAIDDVELMDEDEVTPIPASKPLPRAPKGDPSAGLPVLFALDGPVIAGRPELASSGWEELALTYASLPAPSREERVEQQLALAHMWEEGAADVERAFLALETALLIAPEHAGAMAALDALAERHDAANRRVQSLRKLAAEATLPEHVIAQGTRLAELHEARGERADAEARWRWILSVVADHRPALARVTAMLAEDERWEEWVQFATRHADADRDDLEPAEWAARMRAIADVVEQRLGRLDDAIDLLRRLVKQVSNDPASHERLAAALTRREEWVPAIETLRHANELRGTGAEVRKNLAAIAELYESRLGFPDRASDTWQLALRDAEADAEGSGHADDVCMALDALVRLARTSGKSDRLIALVDRRLEAGPLSDDAKIELLLAKAAAQREIFDQVGALATLETLHGLAPDDDRVVGQMAELLRATGDTARALTMLRERVAALRAAESPKRATASLQLAEALLATGTPARDVLAELGEATTLDPHEPTLRELEARLAREVGDDTRLVAALAASPSVAAVLEAASLAAGRLGDRVLATRLYARVQAETRACAEEAELELHRLALEGLVRLRLGDGDPMAALDWMARQIDPIEPPRARARLLADLGHITWSATRDLDAAKAHFDAALAVDASDPSASVGRGELMLAAGEHAKAEAELLSAYDAMTAMGLRGRDPARALVALAAALEAQDRGADAYRRLTNALRHDGDNLGIRLAIVRNRALASRWKDALTAVDQIDQTLGSRALATFAADELRAAADAQVIGAEGEAQVGTPEGAIRRLRRAIELSPDHAKGLDALAKALAQQGQLVESAEYAARAAEHEPDARARARAFVEAGMSMMEAAEDTAAPDLAHELRRKAFALLGRGLALVADVQTPVLDRARLETILRIAADEAPDVALSCLDRLLLREEVTPEHREVLILQGCRIALRAGQTGRAEDLARLAVTLRESGAAPQLALFETLQATGRTSDALAAVEAFFAAHVDDAAAPGDSTQSEERADRTELRLAQADALLQEDGGGSRREAATIALEHAFALAGDGLDAGVLARLATLHTTAGRDDATSRAVLRALVRQDARHPDAIRSLARIATEDGELAMAWALHRVLVLLDADDAAATAFFAAHVERPREGSAGREVLEPAIVARAAGPDAGMNEALSLLVEQGATLLVDLLGKPTHAAAERVSPVGDSPLARGLDIALRRIAASKAVVVKGTPDESPGRTATKTPLALEFASPVIVVTSSADDANASEARFAFALARALWLAKPDHVLAAALAPETFADLCSTLLVAFHPRHTRRKSHVRNEDGALTRWVQEFARKLPIKVARQLGTIFKDHEHESFSSVTWREQIAAEANRAALVITGDVAAAVAELSDERGLDTPAVRTLLTFAASPEYVAARATLGLEVVATGEGR